MVAKNHISTAAASVDYFHFRPGICPNPDRDAHLAMLQARASARLPVARASDFEHDEDACHIVTGLAGNLRVNSVKTFLREPDRPPERLEGPLGQRIKQVRERLRLSRPELAKRAGMGLNTLWQVEWGADIEFDDLIRIARAMNIRLATLVAGLEREE